jgi:serine/threonine protein phosphatase PrpC
MAKPEALRLFGGLVVVYSSRCPGKESSNEDAAAIYPVHKNVSVLVVADGLGGLRAGEQASGLTLLALRNAINRIGNDSEILRSAILDGIEDANRNIRQWGIGSASTLAVVEIQGNTVRPYHAGDSMVLVCGGRGKIKLQTVPHSPVGFALESGILNEHEAMHHKDRHLVSNVIGMPEMRIEIGSTLKFNPRDTLLLASDGLFDNLHVDEIVEHIRKGPLLKSVGALIDETKSRMIKRHAGLPSKPDDLTVLAYRPSGR